MTDDKHDGKRGLLDKLIALLLRLDWPDVLGNVWRALRKALPGQSYKGLYAQRSLILPRLRRNWVD